MENTVIVDLDIGIMEDLTQKHMTRESRSFKGIKNSSRRVGKIIRGRSSFSLKYFETFSIKPSCLLNFSSMFLYILYPIHLITFHGGLFGGS